LFRKLIAVGTLGLLLTGCAAARPAASTPTLNPPTFTLPAPTDMPAPTRTEPTAAASPEPTPAAVATSRGPELEATDPSTVGLASGGLQLVEFFRFT